MIYEFAVDPEEVASWAEREKYKHVYDSFGVGTPRILCHMPEDWTEMVWDAFGEGTPDDNARVEELIKMMSERMIKRNTADNDWSENWLRKIFEEHDRTKFYAIISTANDTERQEVLTYDDLNVLNEIWNLHVRRNFTRCAAGFAECFRPILRVATEIRYVDANLRPRELRHQAVSAELFSEIVAQRPPEGLKVQFYSQDAEHKTSHDLFVRELMRWPKKVIPNGLEVEFIRLQENGNTRFHDRFILTEFGGVNLPDSFDEEDGDPTPEGGRATVMTKADYAKEWHHFSNTTKAFKKAGSVILRGEKP